MAQLPHIDRTGRQEPDPRPKNRAVENENLQPPAAEGLPPMPATTPIKEGRQKMAADQKAQAEKAQSSKPVVIPPRQNEKPKD